jgi:hypothetical protein
MSRSNYENFLKLEKKRQKLITKLFSIKEMVQGSFCLIHVRCGKKRCQCNQGKLHPHYRMSMRRNGKQLSRAVPKEEHAWIAEMTDNYREYRRILKALNVIEQEAKELLNMHEQELIQKSSKDKSYLVIKTGNSETKFEKGSENMMKTDIKI